MTRRNRTLSITTYETDADDTANLRIDIGEPEGDHFNVVTSASIREQGNRTILANNHVDYDSPP